MIKIHKILTFSYKKYKNYKNSIKKYSRNNFKKLINVSLYLKIPK